MKQKLIITTLTIFLVTASSLTANARYCDDDRYGPPVMSESEYGQTWRGDKQRKYQHEMVTELLGLTEEQQEQISAIREEQRTASKVLRGKMREYRKQIRELSDAGSFDENAIRTLAEEKAGLQVEMTVSRARMHSKIHGIMTPEQLELAQKLRSVRQKRGGKHRGYGPGPGMDGGRPDFD